MKTFKEILEQTHWLDGQNQIIKVRPKQENNLVGYANVYYSLFDLTPAENLSGCTIVIYLAEDTEGNEYYTVSGLKDGEKYAIEYTPWEEWLGFYIDEELFSTMSLEEIVAYCLYEMTWGGYTQEDIYEHIEDVFGN